MLTVIPFRGTVRFELSFSVQDKGSRLTGAQVKELQERFPNVDIYASRHISRFDTETVPLDNLEIAEKLSIGIYPRKYPAGYNYREDLLNITNWILAKERRSLDSQPE